MTTRIIAPEIAYALTNSATVGLGCWALWVAARNGSRHARHGHRPHNRWVPLR